MKYFIEIGSNNYDTLYNLCEQGWKGVMVEPVKEVFDSLPKHENLMLLNLAIAENEGVKDFYVVNSTTAWSSLKPDHHKRVDSNSGAEIIKVQAITFDKLMELSGFPYVDFLKIDTEGYDATIIKSIDFNKHQIKRIQFEHLHMSVRDYLDLADILTDAGFDLIGADDSNANWEKI